jgi:hypothetical protein
MQYHHFKSLAYFLNHRDEELREYYRRLLMDPEETLKKKQRAHIASSPALMYSRKWVQKSMSEDAAGHTLGDINYNTYRRIKRRFHTEVFGYDYAKQFEGWSYYRKGEKIGEKHEFFKAYEPLPSCPVQKLDFSPLGLPGFAQIAGSDYDGVVIDSIDDEDDDDV